jgi:hypothetical protein
MKPFWPRMWDHVFSGLKEERTRKRELRDRRCANYAKLEKDLLNLVARTSYLLDLREELPRGRRAVEYRPADGALSDVRQLRLANRAEASSEIKKSVSMFLNNVESALEHVNESYFKFKLFRDTGRLWGFEETSSEVEVLERQVEQLPAMKHELEDQLEALLTVIRANHR